MISDNLAALEIVNYMRNSCPIFLYQSSSVAQLCLTLFDAMDCSMPGSLSIMNSWSFLKLMSIESLMLSNHLILYRPVLLPLSVITSIRVFSNELVLHIRWPKR